jgi:hypothetical protein
MKLTNLNENLSKKKVFLNFFYENRLFRHMISCLSRGARHLGLHHIFFWEIWEILGVFGKIWEYLGNFGNIWEHLGKFGKIWEHLRKFEKSKHNF